MTFTGSNVLITGASRGIGASIAKSLAKRGLKVWINYRSKPEIADALKDEIIADGGRAAVVSFDVTDEAGFIAGIKAIVQSDGELSYIVNNAGITKDKLVLRMKTQEFMDVINANLTSTFIGCREGLKVMSKKRFGSVVNISSIVGETGNAGQVNYSASKGGVNAMTKSFAQEAASRSVRFNSITPGFIATEMTDELSDEVKESYTSKIPLKRFGSTDDIANAVAFLLSDESSYITGEVLRVNGGMLM
ncbi:MAG: 3-oxoacyl-[acyl-carrier protein] reductase (EC [uncultured Campylobacterales bacterium]|uniref:3-oxoacyl-[acyl-carrier-protein] reductase n=1 Tax=uncultured Campylobacterales bacterium TaxID=352960 RepID=A0A6S6T9R2_9BACT|nr:MAG: 3-oxoacyl-[acyl-carrier protein] reductase (EC [uncultured Campylobacterales bacterium]